MYPTIEPKKKNILIGCTGSVASIKLPELVKQLAEFAPSAEIKIIVTQHAEHFFQRSDIPHRFEICTDNMEWVKHFERGDPIPHIDLGRWADIFVIAPLDANTLAKISNGLCDNLLTCTLRAWEMQKPVLFCPAMNTRMYDHPVTGEQITKLKSWGYHEVPTITKTLMCGETGNGAMAEVSTIVEAVLDKLDLNKIS